MAGTDREVQLRNRVVKHSSDNPTAAATQGNPAQNPTANMASSITSKVSQTAPNPIQIANNTAKDKSMNDGGNVAPGNDFDSTIADFPKNPRISYGLDGSMIFNEKRGAENGPGPSQADMEACMASNAGAMNPAGTQALAAAATDMGHFPFSARDFMRPSRGSVKSYTTNSSVSSKAQFFDDLGTQKGPPGQNNAQSTLIAAPKQPDPTQPIVLDAPAAVMQSEQATGDTVILATSSATARASPGRNAIDLADTGRDTPTTCCDSDGASDISIVNSIGGMTCRPKPSEADAVAKPVENYKRFIPGTVPKAPGAAVSDTIGSQYRNVHSVPMGPQFAFSSRHKPSVRDSAPVIHPIPARVTPTAPHPHYIDPSHVMAPQQLTTSINVDDMLQKLVNSNATIIGNAISTTLSSLHGASKKTTPSEANWLAKALSEMRRDPPPSWERGSALLPFLRFKADPYICERDLSRKGQVYAIGACFRESPSNRKRVEEICRTHLPDCPTSFRDRLLAYKHIQARFEDDVSDELEPMLPSESLNDVFDRTKFALSLSSGMTINDQRLNYLTFARLLDEKSQLINDTDRVLLRAEYKLATHSFFKRSVSTEKQISIEVCRDILDEVDSQRKPSNVVLYVAPQTHAMSERTCYNCGTPGHLARDCTRPRKITCYQCGASGHIARDCPKKSNSRPTAQIQHTTAASTNSKCSHCNATNHSAGTCPYLKCMICLMKGIPADTIKHKTTDHGVKKNVTFKETDACTICTGYGIPTSKIFHKTSEHKRGVNRRNEATSGNHSVSNGTSVNNLNAQEASVSSIECQQMTVDYSDRYSRGEEEYDCIVQNNNLSHCASKYFNTRNNSNYACLQMRLPTGDIVGAICDSGCSRDGCISPDLVEVLKLNSYIQQRNTRVMMADKSQILSSYVVKIPLTAGNITETLTLVSMPLQENLLLGKDGMRKFGIYQKMTAEVDRLNADTTNSTKN